MPTALRACHCCGLVQQLGEVPPGSVARCVRCRSIVPHRTARRAASRTVAFSLAALILYVPAMMLPVLEVERLGTSNSATIWSGVVSLMADGEVLVATIVFLASIVAPVAKIGAMLTLSAGDALLPRRDHRAWTYRVVDWIGRWGMLDVLLVAILVAAVKLGSWIEVRPGPGVLAFAGTVVFSLLASAVFDPQAIWEDEP